MVTNIRYMAECYDEEVARYAKAAKRGSDIDIDAFVEADPRRIKWTRELKDRVRAGRPSPKIDTKAVAETLYRPYTRLRLYYDRMYVSQMYKMPKLFPEPTSKNLCILVSGLGGPMATCLVTDLISNLNSLHSGCQAFPLSVGEEPMDSDQPALVATGSVDGTNNISAFALRTFRAAYGPAVSAEDIFFYAYAVLSSPEYRERFASSLSKMLPRIPLTREAADFRAFTKAGRDLAQWHLNYETVEPYDLQEHSNILTLDPDKHFTVSKMTYARPSAEQKAKGEKHDKTTIIYNSHITLSGIPPQALEYVVNGKPALEWIMERYQLTRDKDSDILNDPNDWAKEHNQPRYIIDLLKRVVRVSVETVRIVKSLPLLHERTSPPATS